MIFVFLIKVPTGSMMIDFKPLYMGTSIFFAKHVRVVANRYAAFPQLLFESRMARLRVRWNVAYGDKGRGRRAFGNLGGDALNVGENVCTLKLAGLVPTQPPDRHNSH